MGIDGLDLIFRIERAFDLRLDRKEGGSLYFTPEELERQKRKPKTHDVTVGDVHTRLCALLIRRGKGVPVDSWEHLQRCVSDCLKVPTEDIHPHSWLIKDLGAT